MLGAALEQIDRLGSARSGRIVALVQRRKINPITTTQELMAIICEARDFTLKRAAGAKFHPASRTFLALRILVNRELANLDRSTPIVIASADDQIELTATTDVPSSSPSS